LPNSPTGTAQEENEADKGASKRQSPAPSSDDQMDRIMRLWSSGLSADEITEQLGDASWKSVIDTSTIDGS
jgi:hypothetical protein